MYADIHVGGPAACAFVYEVNVCIEQLVGLYAGLHHAVAETLIAEHPKHGVVDLYPP